MPSASVVPNRLRPVRRFLLIFLHKATQSYQFFLRMLPHAFLFLLSFPRLDLLLFWPTLKMPFGREGTALYPYISCIARAFAVPICCGIPINNVWQKAAWDNPRPAHLTFRQRETRRKQTTPLDTRTQSNLVQGGWNKAFHFKVFWGNWFQLSTPTSGLAHRAWKEINGNGFKQANHNWAHSLEPVWSLEVL